MAAAAQSLIAAGSTASISPPHSLRQNRRSAVRGNGDDERRTIDDRAELEIREGGLVDDVGERAERSRHGAKFRRLRRALDVADRQRGAVQIVRLKRAPHEANRRAPARKIDETRAGLCAIDVDIGSGGLRQLGLPQHGGRAAGERDAPALQVEEHRQRGEVPPSPGALRRRLSPAVKLWPLKRFRPIPPVWTQIIS